MSHMTHNSIPSFPSTLHRISSVYYANGTCTVRSPWASVDPCTPVAAVAVPAPSGTWTCGLETTGTFECTADGSTYATARDGATTVSAGPGTVPVSTEADVAATRVPTNYSFSVPSTEGTTATQSGSVGAGGSDANAAISGTGSVGAVAVAGPGGASTSTTDNGVTTTGSTGSGASAAPALTFGQVNGQSGPAPQSFVWSSPSAEQSGSVTPGSSVTDSRVSGSGPVSAVSVAGPGSAVTSTTQDGQTTSNAAGDGATPSVVLPTFTRPTTAAAAPAPEEEASDVYVVRVGSGTAGAAISRVCRSSASALAMNLPGQA